MAAGCFGKCCKTLLLLSILVTWLLSLALLVFGVWMLLDPRRNYLLDLVHFTQDDPLLRISVYIFIAVGTLSSVAACVGSCGALREVPCLLVGHSLLTAVFLAAVIGSCATASMFMNQMLGKFHGKFSGLVRDLYGRMYWADDVVDRVQYWRQCCGASGPEDWTNSWWQINRSFGTLQIVPESCCAQTIDSWPNQLKPIDPETCLFSANAPASSRYNVGCNEKLLEYLRHHINIFLALGLCTAALEIFSILLSVCLCRSLR